MPKPLSKQVCSTNLSHLAQKNYLAGNRRGAPKGLGLHQAGRVNSRRSPNPRQAFYGGNVGFQAKFRMPGKNFKVVTTKISLMR